MPCRSLRGPSNIVRPVNHTYAHPAIENHSGWYEERADRSGMSHPNSPISAMPTWSPITAIPAGREKGRCGLNVNVSPVEHPSIAAARTYKRCGSRCQAAGRLTFAPSRLSLPHAAPGSFLPDPAHESQRFALVIAGQSRVLALPGIAVQESRLSGCPPCSRRIRVRREPENRPLQRTRDCPDRSRRRTRHPRVRPRCADVRSLDGDPAAMYSKSFVGRWL